MKAILDANRNSLMLLDLKFSIGTLGIGAGTFVAALYGMNLKSFIEEWDWGFPLVSLTCAVFTAIASVYGLRKLRRVQRISMWGEGEVGGKNVKEARRWVQNGGREDCAGSSEQGKGSWREVEPVADRLERMERMEWKTAERLRMLRIMERKEALRDFGDATAKEGGPSSRI